MTFRSVDVDDLLHQLRGGDLRVVVALAPDGDAAHVDGLLRAVLQAGEAADAVGAEDGAAALDADVALRAEPDALAAGDTGVGGAKLLGLLTDALDIDRLGIAAEPSEHGKVIVQHLSATTMNQEDLLLVAIGVEVQRQLGLGLRDLVGDDIGILKSGIRPSDQLDGLPQTDVAAPFDLQTLDFRRGLFYNKKE